MVSFPPRKLGHQITLLAIGGIVLLAVVLVTFNLFENRQRALAAEQAALRSQLQNVEAVIKNTSHETVLAATLIAQRPDAARAVADKDWQTLASLFDPLWSAIKAQGIQQFHFHIPRLLPFIGCTSPQIMATTSRLPGWQSSR